MKSYPPVFDVLYSVSDIHMGGASHDQIFAQGERLGNFVRHLGDDIDGEVALVLNGDIIDSLAEEEAEYVALSERAASRMIGRIIDDEAFAPVWSGLAHYLTSPRHHLIIVAGNHDIELALPIVEHAIRMRLAGDDAAADGRIIFSASGAGYACSVGNARIHCTHGHEHDPFNRVDNEKLGQLANAQNAGRVIAKKDWIPNPGTRIVVDVMNDLKSRFAFVDILKPQQASVAGVLLSLKADALDLVGFADLRSINKSMWRSRRAQGRLLDVNDIADEDEIAPEDAYGTAAGLLGENLAALVAASPRDEGEDALLLAAEKGQLPTSVEGANGEQTLGVGAVISDVVRGLIPGTDSKEALRCALQDWLMSAKHRETDDEDFILKELKKQKPQTNANFTIAGHTHCARSNVIRDDSYYFNSGTWIRLMCITPEALADAEAFTDLWNALQEGSLAALDKLEIIGPDGTMQSVIDDYTTAVRVRDHKPDVVGELLRVFDDGSKVDVVPDSKRVLGGTPS